MNLDTEELKELLKNRFAWAVLLWEYAPVHLILSMTTLLIACVWVVLFRLNTDYLWLLLLPTVLSGVCIAVNAVARQKYLTVFSAIAFAGLAGAAVILYFFPSLWSFEQSRFGPDLILILLVAAVSILAPRIMHPNHVSITTKNRD